MFFFFTIYLPTLFAVAASASTVCKAVPGSAHWPIQSAWHALNESVDGALLAPLPPAIVCDASRPATYSQQSCSNLPNSKEWYNSTFHATNPVSVDWPNFQGDGCLPTKLYGDAKEACNLKPFPHYVVRATNGQQVAAAIKFAVKNNVRLSVKGTGHDLLGRSTSPGLSIWTYNIRGLHMDKSFKPQGCKSCSGTSAITVGAGEAWHDVYEVVFGSKQFIVGGGEPTVGMGGWTTGGGHSPLSAIYGLGADNLLEVEMVTPTGAIVTANSYHNSDLFWAMRGGGGATFGIGLSFTFKLHPAKPLTSFAVQFNSTQAEATQHNNSHFYDAVARINAQLPTYSDAGLMGYWYMNPIQYGIAGVVGGYNPVTKATDNPVPMTFSFIGIADASVDNVRKLFANASEDVTETPGLEPPLLYIEPESVLNLLEIIVTSQNPVGSNVMVGSRLLDREALLDEKAMRAALPTFWRAGLQGIFTTGPGVRSVPVNENSVNPAWRTAYLHLLVPLAIPFENFEKLVGPYSNYLTTVLAQKIRELGPNSGAYINEADPNEPDYTKVFWGSHYPRLLSIKEKYDPTGVLWCKQCVGGDKWKVKADGELCQA